MHFKCGDSRQQKIYAPTAVRSRSLCRFFQLLINSIGNEKTKSNKIVSYRNNTIGDSQDLSQELR